MMIPIKSPAWFSKLKPKSNKTIQNPAASKGGGKGKQSKPSSSSASSSTLSSILSSSSSSSSTSSSSNKTGFQHQRKSYYFTRDPPSSSSSPKDTSSTSSRRNRVPAASKSHLLPSSSTCVSTGCICRSSSLVTTKKQPPPESEATTGGEVLVFPENPPAPDTTSSSSSSSDVDSTVAQISCGTSPMTSTLISPREMSPISNGDKPDQWPDRSGSPSEEFRLPPIKTSSDDSRNGSWGTADNTGTRLSPNFRPGGGVKLRSNSPRLIGMSKRVMMGRRKRKSGGRRRSLSESFAVVKASRDPKRDFRESMLEMIVENKIQGSRDLEDLLACYLSLNSEHYHELIIAVFKQIWFDLIVQV